MGWQPIETAPADMAEREPPRLLLWVANGGWDGQDDSAFGRVYIGEHTNERHASAEGYSGGWNITHWMPLPAPPEDTP